MTTFTERKLTAIKTERHLLQMKRELAPPPPLRYSGADPTQNRRWYD